MERGRVQIFWSCTNQTRAGTQRDWLNAQLSGRNFISEALPTIALKGGVWVTIADVAFDTVAEGNTVEALAITRQNADQFILSDTSFVRKHTCRHDEGIGDCSDSIVLTVKP